MHKSSSQAALNNFLEREGITMSQQALSKARSKFDHTPFLKLFTAVRDAFYGTEYIDTLRKYNNKFLIAIDGSNTSLPNLPSLLKKFGGTGSKVSSPTARMSIAYDVLNDFIIDAAFTPLNISERTHAQNHIESVGKIIDLENSIFIMDRGYASKELIEILAEKSNFLFRLRSKFNTDIDALPLGSHIITMYDNIKVRVVKFTLPSGEIETLLTNLFELNESEFKELYNESEFKELYFKRWRIEVEYDVVKNKLELPCFGGFSENVIMQDFWITMYLANMVAIIKNEADQEIAEERKDKDNKYEYQANVNTLIGSMRDRLADAVFSRNPAHLEVKKSVVPIRPDDGNTPRYENTRKSSHHHNKRHNL